MKNVLRIYLIGGLLLLGIGAYAAYNYWIAPDEETAEAENAVSAEDTAGEAAEDPGKEKVEGRQSALTVPSKASEKEILDMMNAMTHQKVIAADKWGIIEMNDQSIDKAYSIVSASDFPSKAGLLEILERWKAGDFSQVDKDHNYIWELQGGSIGRATGIMTPEQEKEFIEINFKD